MSAVREARERGWERTARQWWTHPTYGAVIRIKKAASGDGWYWFRRTGTGRGPYPTMIEAMDAAEKAAKGEGVSSFMAAIERGWVASDNADDTLLRPGVGRVFLAPNGRDWWFKLDGAAPRGPFDTSIEAMDAAERAAGAEQ